MTDAPQQWVGVDPGGHGHYGVALLEGSTVQLTGTVSCTDDAIKLLSTVLTRAPAGVGIDAPMWWSSGRSSDRMADQWLRRTQRLSGGQVQATNSLQGAALVQAAMFAQRIRALYPLVPITETHPKAVLRATAGNDWETFAKKHGIDGASHQEHARDAIIGAVAAREGFTGSWTRDLSTERHASEQDPKKYWLAPVHYFWPEPS